MKEFLVGDEFRELFTCTPEISDGFIKLFRDRNPLHISNSVAVEKGFKEAVMHGNILGGFLSYFIGECLPSKNVIILSQEIQYKNAVYLNDVLQFSAVVTAISESVNVIEFKYWFRLTGTKTAATGKFKIKLT